MDQSETKPAAGLIYGPDSHHLDHLGPLCEILGIPLIVTEEAIALAANKYYPNLDVIFSDYFAVAQHLITHYEIIFYSIPRVLFDEVFFFAQKLAQKKVHTIWCPHGNSDKGNNIPYMEALHREEVALMYGQQMIDFLKRKNVLDQLKSRVVTGNFRHAYYLQNKQFFDALADKEVFRRLPQSEKTILYAPTWKDNEKSTSFFDAATPLIEGLPENWNLIIKLHPNLILQEEFQIDSLIHRYEGHSRLLFLTEFPPVYPLLSRIDIYIGDMSSIGYDFLAFDRPMFFLNQNARDPESDLGLYLFRCGVEVLPEKYQQIYPIIQNFLQFELRDYSKIRRQVYDYAFGSEKPLETLRKEITAVYASFPESDLNFY
ncbi:MAG: CDP-glycerol glycerophosphotransferase family protein [Verrucomicrobia bacterium]|nr:CDP-glycerol glycerophosphotransferase family protein [Verrucomicrobiota bacterium]